MDWRQRNDEQSRSVAVLSCTGYCTAEPTENDIFGKTLKFYTYRLVKYVQVSETTLWGVHSIIINWENMLCPVCCFVDYFSLCQWTLFQIVQYILEYSSTPFHAGHTIKQNVFRGYFLKHVHTSKNMWVPFCICLMKLQSSPVHYYYPPDLPHPQLNRPVQFSNLAKLHLSSKTSNYKYRMKTGVWYNLCV